MIIINKDIPRVFDGKTILISSNEDKAFDVIADSLVNRGPLVELLRKHDFEVTQNTNKQDLLNALKQAYSKESFRVEYAKKYIAKNRTSNLDDEEASVHDSSPSASSTNSGGSSSSGGGFGWLNAISGIVNGVGGILGAFQKPDYTGQQINYNQQLLLLAAQKEKQKTTKIIVIVSSIVAVIIVGIIIYSKRKK